MLCSRNDALFEECTGFQAVLLHLSPMLSASTSLRECRFPHALHAHAETAQEDTWQAESQAGLNQQQPVPYFDIA